MTPRKNILLDERYPTQQSLRDELPFAKEISRQMWYANWRRLLFGVLFGFACGMIAYATYSTSVDFHGTATDAFNNKMSFVTSTIIYLAFAGYFLACTPWRKFGHRCIKLVKHR